MGSHELGQKEVTSNYQDHQIQGPAMQHP